MLSNTPDTLHNNTYIGETERSLKARFGEHRRQSSTTSEVLKHIHMANPNHNITLENTKILSVEHKLFKRGVKEAIHIRALNPSLNRDSGCYNMPLVWNNIIKERRRVELRPPMEEERGGGEVLRNSVSATISLQHYLEIASHWRRLQR